IFDLINQQEDSKLEFKLDDIHPNDLAAEMVAFTNLEGGIILLGVNDKGEAVGIKKDNIEEWVMNIARENCMPGIIPVFDIEEVKGKKIVKLEIPRGFVPHKIKDGKYYIRVGSTKREATQEELARLFQRAQMVDFDTTPVVHTVLDDIDFNKVNKWLEKLGRAKIEESDLAPEQLLKNLEILTEFEENTIATVGGLLMFGKKPQKFLANSGAVAVIYKGKEVSDNVINQKEITGSLDEVIDELISFVRKNMRESYNEKIVKRKEKTEYPLIAFQEVIVNAVAHRNYSIFGSRIRLFMFDDRLEIYSPGSLPNTITLQNIQYRQFTRNQIIVRFLADLGYIEHRGEGIRKISKAMKDYNLPEPQFELLGEELRVILRSSLMH
ncbi:MAG: ATP-binding protein, partial [Candidatus Kuenenbacteria bacterium]